MRLDLHLHSTASDGALPPDAVVRAALAARLDVIALTDHDTTAGVAAAMEAARAGPIQIIPGIEVSSTFQGREIHVLGYFVDPASQALSSYVRRARTVRLRVAAALTKR